MSTNFVRGTLPPRAPSPAGTIISQGTTTWMTNPPPVQLIRASISQSPRARIVSQTTIPASNVSGVTNIIGSGNTNATISANIVSQSQAQQQQQQIVTSQTSGQQQTFVATLATVLPPRQQTATLVYSNVTNPQQQFSSTQRLAVATPLITGQRAVRPIQLSNARVPAPGGIRVSTANISIRGPNIPVLAPSSVLTSLPNTIQGRTTTVSASNLNAAGLPAARIIQVQQPQSGGTAQVISAGRLSGNLMTLHPVIMNATTAGNRATSTAKVQPSLTITHVGKLATAASVNNQQGGIALTTANLSQAITSSGNTIQQQQQLGGHSTSSPIGIVTTSNQSNQSSVQGQQHQIAQIVGINQQGGVNVSHGHQIVNIYFTLLFFFTIHILYTFFT